jgi:hypothetical protein
LLQSYGSKTTMLSWNFGALAMGLPLMSRLVISLVLFTKY